MTLKNEKKRSFSIFWNTIFVKTYEIIMFFYIMYLKNYKILLAFIEAPNNQKSDGKK